jgi:hypothetical protein
MMTIEIRSAATQRTESAFQLLGELSLLSTQNKKSEA